MDIKIDLPISKETVSNILEPTLIPLSKSIGGIIQWVFQKPIEYGIVRPIELENLKKRTEKQLNLIPETNRTSEKLGLTLKAFEDARYQLDNELLIDYFAKLIAGTVDDRADVKALYSSILSEMSEENAKLFGYFSTRKHLFENQINHSNPAFIDDRYRYYSPMNYFLISGDFQEGMHRNTDGWNDIFSDNVVLADVENSVLFLKSKGLIFADSSQNSHVLINVVEAKNLVENEWLKEISNKYANFKYNKVTQQETTVYSLTSLGYALAELVCRED